MATFVARNGAEFEEKIRLNELNNVKFSFLNPIDPYHAFYQHKVKEIEDTEGSMIDLVTETTGLNKQHQMVDFEKLKPSAKVFEFQSNLINKMIILKEPPTEFEFITETSSISPLDLDVIKLTAQFVARNGRPLLSNFLRNQQRNPMFDFLKPQHGHFNLFTKLVDQYTKILLPPRDLIENMKKEVSNPQSILRTIEYRVEWEKTLQREKMNENEMIEKERAAYAQIDWYDFVVVETIDLHPSEQGNFLPPTTPQNVGARVIAQERAETIEVNNKIITDTIIADDSGFTDQGSIVAHNQIKVLIDKNVDQADDLEESRGVHIVNTKHKNALKTFDLIIRKNYDPKTTKSTSKVKKIGEEYLKSPITGEFIPASMMSEHLRISMLDPRWLEQKEKKKKTPRGTTRGSANHGNKH